MNDADAARKAAADDGTSARKALCSPPINNGTDAVADCGDSAAGWMCSAVLLMVLEVLLDELALVLQLLELLLLVVVLLLLVEEELAAGRVCCAWWRCLR